MTDGLREFVCKHCGHTVVVNPMLPPDYTPNTCTPCWEQFEKPRTERAALDIYEKAVKLLRMCGFDRP